jgi:hypothetical protein
MLRDFRQANTEHGGENETLDKTVGVVAPVSFVMSIATQPVFNLGDRR